MTEQKKLETNKTDFLVSFAKSAVGTIPVAGPLLSELIGSVIPNQRIDRLTKYLNELDQRLSNIKSSILDELRQDEEFIDLVEEGFVQASRATSDERRKYIASIIENGIKDESIEFLDSKYLLKLLAELNDIEIIWLRFYLDPTLNGDVEFRNRHKTVLKPISSYKEADKETFNKSSIQDSYKEHLERLQLLESHLKVDRKIGLPEFNTSTGKPKVASRRITYLGRMLLENIGLKND